MSNKAWIVVLLVSVLVGVLANTMLQNYADDFQNYSIPQIATFENGYMIVRNNGIVIYMNEEPTFVVSNGVSQIIIYGDPCSLLNIQLRKFAVLSKFKQVKSQSGTSRFIKIVDFDEFYATRKENPEIFVNLARELDFDLRNSAMAFDSTSVPTTQED